MDSAVTLLRTYRGHGKVMRATSNICLLLSSLTKGKLATDLRTIGRHMLGAGMVERLFDDIMTLSTTIGYGWGTQVE